jgi:hypothetical protein
MPAVWSSLRTVAEYSQPGWRVALDPALPSSPLVLESTSGTRWEALAITPLPGHSMVAEEIYVRQQDLIARFGQIGTDEYSFQVDWRLIEAPLGFDVGLEVWVSLQTNLLDTAPKIQVASQGIGAWTGWRHQQLVSDADASSDADQGWSSGNVDSMAGLLSSGKSCSCLWLIEPRDLQQVHWTSKPSSLVQQAELFGAFLEKGVIRRARMQLLVSHQPIALPDVQRAYQGLINRELPLTA